MSYKVLIIDDDDRIRTLLAKYLSEHNYDISCAENAENALALLENSSFDIIIMDVMMPGESGINLTSRLKSKAHFDTPIIMLSALSEPENRISGLEIGADDYLTKPFEPKELLLRISKLISRKSTKDEIRFSNFVLNLKTRKLYQEGKLIPLTSSEMNLLHILGSNINKSVSREELSRLSFGIGERSIDVQIVRLRNKIEKDPKEPEHLLTIRNVGYGLYT